MPLATDAPTAPAGYPWEARALELEEEHGPYCFYVAWEQHVCRGIDAMFPADDPSWSFEDMDGLAKIALYRLMCEPYEAAYLAAKGDDHAASPV